jgi:hypothetical protein
MISASCPPLMRGRVAARDRPASRRGPYGRRQQSEVLINAEFGTKAKAPDQSEPVRVDVFAGPYPIDSTAALEQLIEVAFAHAEHLRHQDATAGESGR